MTNQYEDTARLMYHGTSIEALPSILLEGLHAGSFVTPSPRLAAAYAKLHDSGAVLQVQPIATILNRTIDIIAPQMIKVHSENQIFIPVDTPLQEKTNETLYQ
jgi:RNA:NAD 2'-phosphotransferase (TPT1/KptA family)